MKKKSEAFEKLKEYITYIERKFDRKPKIVQVDRGGEFVNDRMKKWCGEKGIELQTTVPYSPSQNGVAE
jgi:transposase InsO family protein